MKICNSCGRQLEDQTRFCDACGQPQPIAPVIREPARGAVQGPKLGSWIIAAVLLLVGLTVGFGIGTAAFMGSQTIVTQRIISATTLTSVQQVSVTQTTTVAGQGQSGLVEYCFSPGGNCASVIIRYINQAQVSIHVLIYSFTLNDVRDALIQAKNRGVDVKVVMDNQQSGLQGSEYGNLKNASVDIRLDKRSASMHDKVALIDGHIIITGSFNWSQAANEDNRENLLVIDNPTWATAYEQQFQTIWNASS